MSSCVFPGDLSSTLSSVTVLVVGAGGIGCELLKNLVLTGFKNIHVIDLDTIDVSNLNRQFLFHKQHVGRSKAEVALESILKFCPTANVKYFHDSVLSPDYDINFFKQYAVVLNALDNKAARSHVNRLCLAADVALVESGSSGYLGQVSVIKKGVTECYECTPKPTQKSYPGCTIRNTPSEPIHCIVWAKHLFNQLYGEADIDEDVSPDMADPELDEVKGEINGTVSNGNSNSQNGTERVSTRKWAEQMNYEPEVLFQKLFVDDIKYLLTMETLWKKRRAPTPLDRETMPDQNPGSSSSNDATVGIKDQVVWTPKQCRDIFESTAAKLKDQLLDKQKENNKALLAWDKDDDVIMDFTSAVSNLRSFIYGIDLKSRFEIKSMAGNIIPAIATTNAMVAGMIVMEAFKILREQWDSVRAVFVARQPNPRGKLLVDQIPDKPNAKCLVCSSESEVYVKLNSNTFTIKHLRDHVLKESLNMVAPDADILDGSGKVIISSEGDLDGLLPKTLAGLGIKDGTRLQCDDFMQQFQVRVVIVHSDDHKLEPGDFVILSDISELQAQQPVEPQKETIESRKRAAQDEMEQIQKSKKQKTA